jgi:hypothetical protein
MVMTLLVEAYKALTLFYALHAGVITGESVPEATSLEMSEGL